MLCANWLCWLPSPLHWLTVDCAVLTVGSAPLKSVYMTAVQVGNKAKEAKRRERKDAMQAADDMLVGHAQVNYKSKLSDVLALVAEAPEWTKLDKIDQIIVFEAVIKDLEKQQEGVKKEARRVTARSERTNRDKFKELLQAQYEEGALHARTLYRGWLEKNKENELYQAVLRQMGSTPRSLFEDLIERIQPEFNAQKQVTTLSALPRLLL